ncbi:MAG: hypothetical protein IJ040_03940 [Lachnospiraceae bacterium]|nr:hypothetical protein [Lachnospiraceae bacterium]
MDGFQVLDDKQKLENDLRGWLNQPELEVEHTEAGYADLVAQLEAQKLDIVMSGDGNFLDIQLAITRLNYAMEELRQERMERERAEAIQRQNEQVQQEERQVQPPEVVEERRLSYWERKRLEKEERKRQQQEQERQRKEQREQYRIFKNDISLEASDQFQVTPVNPELLTSDYVVNEKLQDTVKVVTNGRKHKVTQQQIMDEVRNSNFTHIEQLKTSIRNMMAAEYMEQTELPATPEEVVATYRNEGAVHKMMHPLFRVGISLGMRGKLRNGNIGHTKEYFRRLDELLNTEVLAQTIIAVPPQELSPVEMERNLEYRIMLAKLMFMGQIGKFNKITTPYGEASQTTRWSGCVANAFAHCSRVSFILPCENNPEQMRSRGQRTAMGTLFDRAQNAGMYKRMAATHSLKKRSKHQGGQEFKEVKAKVNFSSHYGLKVPIGGLGNGGTTGQGGVPQQIKDDGTCGLVYFKIKEGDANDYSAILAGLESDAPGMTNLTGHTHGLGNPEFMSSTGGLRTDEIGDKYGGRQIDLTGITPEFYARIMDCFAERMRIHSGNPDVFDDIIRRLCGDVLNNDDLKQLFLDIFGENLRTELTDSVANRIIANRGYQN